MRTTFVAAVISLICINDTLAQSGKIYADFTKESELFSDMFNDNYNSWRKFYKAIGKGKYDVETFKKDGSATSTIPLRIDMSKNFQIEVMGSVEWNKTKDFMGVVWSMNEENGYYVGTNKLQEIIIYQIEAGTKKILVGPEHSDLLYKMYDDNLFTIRKIGSDYFIFINRKFAYQFPAAGFKGDDLGFFVGPACTFRAKRITVSSLK